MKPNTISNHGRTAAEDAAITKAVEARVDGYIEAARRRDVDWFLDFWADVEGFVFAGAGGLCNYAALAQQIREWVGDTREVTDFAFYNRHTCVLARDAAVHTAQYRWAVTRMNGDTLRMRGSWSYVFKNFDGVWRVVHSAGTHIPE